jgi:NADPH-dependent 2,4-dienoyl-CoA reductase/sulfur reductase-like enzyme/rhodanese-related sulfurtransferase
MAAKKIVIIGGVAGGASAAARLRRLDEDASIVLIERGEYISFANCGLPYHISGEIADREDLLVQSAQGMRRRFKIDVRTRHEARGVDPARRTVAVHDLEKGLDYEEAYDELILSPGAAPIRPPLPGAELPGVFTLRNMADMDAIKAVVDGRPQGRVLILGGGSIGLELAEALRHRQWDVLLAELGPQVMGPADPEMAALLHRELRAQGVDLRLKTGVIALRARPEGGLQADLGGSSEGVDLVVMAVGVRPETRLAVAAGLSLGPKGGIQVDARMRSSDPHIWAVGDAVEVKDLVTGADSLIPLAGPANRQGRIAADNICGLDSRYKGTQGTAIARVFNLSIAMTGASEKALKAAGRPYQKVYLHPNCHAGYFPGATQLQIKVLFDPADGRLLGGQAVGQEGVDKRIDVLAVALRAGLSVYDLEELELAYAPPYGSAKDPVNFAGFIAANVLEGQAPLVQPEELDRLKPDQVLLDTRTVAEHRQGSIPGSLNIPLDELRDRLSELPLEKEVLLYCRVGLRGYLAQRILVQHGYRARNLSGGYLTWQTVQEAAAVHAPQPLGV